MADVTDADRAKARDVLIVWIESDEGISDLREMFAAALAAEREEEARRWMDAIKDYFFNDPPQLGNETILTLNKKAPPAEASGAS